MGPNNLVKGSYNPSALSNDQRQWLWQQFGHSGNAPAGYGGEHVDGDYGQNYSQQSNGQYGLNASQQALGAAKAAQEMQIQANQPAIQTLQTQYNPDTGTGSLVDRYSALLDSITQSEQPAINSVVKSTNNELGRRGITADSGIAQNQMAQAQLPVTTQFGQLKANTGLAEQQDLGGLAGQIANLRAGNVGQGLTFGANVGNLTNQAQQIANTFTLGTATNANNLLYARLASQFQNVPSGNNLVNTLNNTAINPATLTSAGGGISSLR